MDKRVYILTTITFIVGLVELIIGGILPLIANDLDITLGRAGLLNHCIFIKLCHFGSYTSFINC